MWDGGGWPLSRLAMASGVRYQRNRFGSLCRGALGHVLLSELWGSMGKCGVFGDVLRSDFGITLQPRPLAVEA